MKRVGCHLHGLLQNNNNNKLRNETRILNEGQDIIMIITKEEKKGEEDKKMMKERLLISTNAYLSMYKIDYLNMTKEKLGHSFLKRSIKVSFFPHHLFAKKKGGNVGVNEVLKYL